MRPEDCEDAVGNIRKAIGNFPDTKMGQFFVFDAVRALHDEGGDAIKIAEAYLAISESGKYTSVGKKQLRKSLPSPGRTRCMY